MDTIDSDSPDFDIRYTEERDCPFLREAIKAKEVLLWLPISSPKESDLFLKVWKSFIKYRCCLTATWKGRPCAMGIIYLMPYRKVAHRCLAQLVIPVQFQGMGIEGALFKNLAHLAKTYFRLETIQMEVMEGAPVIAPLAEQGFTEFVCQEKYFKVGTEYYARRLFEKDLKDE